MATTFLNLNLPTVSVTLGPTWATQVNAAFETIDAHDHTSGKGARIPSAALNINADIDFNDYAITNLELTNYTNRSTTPSGASFAGSISIASGNLYYTNTSGIAIQLTSGGSIVTSPGSFSTFEVVNVSADLIISPSDTFVYLIVDTTATRNITLPLANAVSSGRVYLLKDASGQSNTNNITVTAAGSDTIDGGATLTINSNLSTTMLVTNGSDSWFVS